MDAQSTHWRDFAGGELVKQRKRRIQQELHASETVQEEDEMSRDAKRNLTSLFERYRGSPEFRMVTLSDVNQRGMTGDSLLHAAVIRGASQDIDILIAAGADVNAVGDLGNTPLHHAASRGLQQIAKRLLDQGANPSIKNEFGQVPADIAKIMKHQELAKTLNQGKKQTS